MPLVARDAAVFVHQQGSSPCLAALHGAGGIWIEQDDGRRLIDLHGNSTHHIGHANPRLIAALKAQLDALPFSPRRYTNAPAVELAEALTRRWPGGAAKVLFATGGSDAIEIALKLARVATGRNDTISLEGSYHGHGFGAFGLSSERTDTRLGSFLPGRHHVTPYWRADLGGGPRMLDDMRRIFAASAGGIAAIVAEPIRSNCHVPPQGLWPEVRALCDAHGARLIFDEIPCGLGKTGLFFAFEHFGAVPDVVVLGKSLGGGILPIAAVVAEARLDVAPELALGHYTHEKNPMTTRAALTTLEIIEDEHLIERANVSHAHVLARMAELSKTHPALHGVRGLGLHLAIELSPEAFPASSDPAGALVAACLAVDVSTTSKGPHAIGFSPPLTITADEIDLALDRIADAVEAVTR